ncbi:MAG: hypothetical protein KDD40_06755, partial [Bdellovibrionales bacterium]|nr:hypothetical protein [Bdellovibrionales bacterium]
FIIYLSDNSTFQLGRERFDFFDIPLDKYKELSPPLKSFSLLSKDIKEKFYTSNDKWRMNLAKRFAVDYFVMDAKLFNGNTNLPIVYANEEILILRSF